MKNLFSSRFTVFFLAGFLALSSAATAFGAFAGFSDLSADHPNARAIGYLKEKEIIGGYADGTFKPDNEVNRVEALKIILLSAGIAVADEIVSAPFSDTAPDEWYAKYVAKAKNLGIVNGNPDGTFRPGNTVNLAEALQIILKSENIDSSVMNVLNDPYDDVPKDTWFAPFVQYAKNHGLISADNSHQVYPSLGMTRGRLAEIIYRLKYIQENGMNIFIPPSATSENIRTIEVEAKRFEFIPSVIRVKLGEKVRLSVTSTDVTHGFSLPEFNINRTIAAQSAEIIEFKATKTGNFPFASSVYCGVGHSGMKGELIVEE